MVWRRISSMPLLAQCVPHTYMEGCICKAVPLCSSRISQWDEHHHARFAHVRAEYRRGAADGAGYKWRAVGAWSGQIRLT